MRRSSILAVGGALVCCAAYLAHAQTAPPGADGDVDRRAVRRMAMSVGDEVVEHLGQPIPIRHNLHRLIDARDVDGARRSEHVQTFHR